MLSLYAFVLSVAHDKLQSPNKAKPRKKTAGDSSQHSQIINEKERVQLLVELMRHLKRKLQNCENAISE